jgi:plastocyanin
MIRSTTIAVVLGAMLAFGASGCGGGGSSASNTTTQATTTSEGSPASASGTLDGEVGPGFDIEVKQNGTDAETVKAGTYTLKVEDKADIHDFHLIGPGVDKVVTHVPFTGEKTVTVTLQKGTYTYQCDPHAASGMKGTFTVT